MTEIDDKELENAAGGAIDIRSGGRECDKYEPKYESYRACPEYQNCLTCSNYERVGITNVCHAGQSYIRKRRYY